MAFETMTVAELKAFLDERELDYEPYDPEEVAEKKEELGGMPSILEEYYTEIVEFSLLEDEGCGNKIRSLDTLFLVTKEILEEHGYPNETEEYVLFASEVNDLDVFVFKTKDMEEENPAVYGAGETFPAPEGEGLRYSALEEWNSIGSILGSIAAFVDEMI